MGKRILYLAGAAVAAMVAVAGAAFGGSPGPGFTTKVDNPWFPLVPGTAYTYIGIKDGKPSRELLTVTHDTKTVAGVRCVVVSDRLYVAGRLVERTSDWYSQDRHGNVWYFGEATAELDASGHVQTTEGSWQAGVDGAKPGILMPARPAVGQTGRQEYYKGHAEDHFRVVAVFGGNGVLTEEWTPLEPGVLDHKLYLRGVGTVLERTVKGGDELNELVSLRR
ncbi:MAG TPA: hypothetical protein VJT84_09930 [Gaiellaceae bacterium]|nr:hypothetical protein [Gaiellaceae bacterium]